MFLKFRKTMLFLLLTYFILPQNVLAYAKEVIVGGNNIGITIHTDGILIAGTYSVNGKDLTSLKAGDKIKEVDGIKVSSINDMVSVFSKSNDNEVDITYIRDDILKHTKLKLVKESDIYKTGLYVKDQISGIGTLTFITKDNTYGALGHEINDSSTGTMLEIKDGKIYSSTVTSIDKSSSGTPGSKNATLDTRQIKGDVLKNTEGGIFGTYTGKIDNGEVLEVASYNEIKVGKAFIKTVVSKNEVKKYEINIIKVKKDKENKIKSILFEITDDELLKQTGGIVQGMSGSPIIQNNKIIGAVTSVVVNHPTRGYGILIEDMLEEAEK